MKIARSSWKRSTMYVYSRVSHSKFLSHELSGWLSSLIGREIGDNIVDALEDGTVGDGRKSQN